MVKDKRKDAKVKEHIGITDVPLISFGDNVFRKLNNRNKPKLNDIYDYNVEDK